jgi:hypothetical protein
MAGGGGAVGGTGIGSGGSVGGAAMEKEGRGNAGAAAAASDMRPSVSGNSVVALGSSRTLPSNGR